MKILVIITSILLSSTFSLDTSPPIEDTGDKIKWYTWEEAMEAMKSEKKKVFIDLYTDWCGWCKRMDKTTFTDPEVIKYMNANYYAVKLDGEEREDIQYGDHTFKYVPEGRRGYHELAAALLEGRMSYPSFVYMDEEIRKITVSPGYKDAEMLMVELSFIADEHFKTTDFNTYKEQYKSK
jgi:thioredoxin-related protein